MHDAGFPDLHWGLQDLVVRLLLLSCCCSGGRSRCRNIGCDFCALKWLWGSTEVWSNWLEHSLWLHTGGAFSHAVSWNNFNEDHERAPVAVFCCFLVVTWRDIWSSPSVCISVIATPKNPSKTCIKTMFFSLQLVWISGFGSLPAAANAVCQQVQGEICREFLKFA